MKFRTQISAIALGMVSLTVPLAVAGTSAAAPAAESTAGPSAEADSGSGERTETEDVSLTDGTGRPAGPLSQQTAAADAGAAGTVFETGEVKGSRFTSLGLSWKKDSPVDGALTAQVRIRRDGVWEPWRTLPLAVDEGVSEEAKRAGAPAFFTDRAEAVDLRLTSPNGSLPQDLRMSFIDPGAGGVTRAAGGGQQPKPDGAPEVKTRAQWGADETIADPGYKLQPGIKAALVHHTVTGNNTYTEEQVPEIVNGIYVHHIRNLGYGDFPYHFVVDRFGGIWEGRKGSREMRPGSDVPGILGGHAAGFNTGTFGVAVLGNFEPNNAEGGEDTGNNPKMPNAARQSLTALLAWKLGQYGLDPDGSARLTSAGGVGNPHPPGTGLDVPVIASHQDVNRTACPGERLYDDLWKVRRDAPKQTG
ncbi:N-acetylmuramoyl-L-alanine amidase [Streptomyces bambusae]|uniref:N-acetylmuramoyl-L-alanine amidase n=1 Tax=Streptomyces bambusae TaxID=1550616 RepID=UPI001CFF0530|nr:N-acetylmuramoyl-L-alanine amidase [Streptomyces bambusae]MCB5164643.1 N-acetylmuramoyl-L-alanine amidase [Streptomyces bambusae]